MPHRARLRRAVFAVTAMFAALSAPVAHAQATIGGGAVPSAFPPMPSAAPSAPLAAAANWTREERAALVAAYLHTAGTSSYRFRIVAYRDERAARAGRLGRWDPNRITLRDADSLVDVPPGWRLALAELHEPGRSRPFQAVNREGVSQWLVIELVSRDKVRDPRDADDFTRKATQWLSRGLLPPPAELMADPAHAARAAYWRAREPADVAALPAGLDPNVRYGNFQTPLTQALFLRRREVAAALLARGADPNLCGFWGCPLQLAAGMDDPAQAEAAVTMLLVAGARVDQIDPQYAGAAETALTGAISQDRIALAERLLAAGASPDGVAGARLTPLQIALVKGRRERAQWLLERGASPLPWTDRGLTPLGLPGTMVVAAREANDAALLAWAEKTMVEAAARSPRFRYDAFIEQGGRRLALKPGATIDLAAAPFTLVLAIPADSQAAVALAASFSRTLAEDATHPERHHGLFVPTRSGALSEPPDPGSYELLVYPPRPEGLKDDESWAGHMSLAADSERRDFHVTRSAQREFLREFRAIAEVPESNDAPRVTPLAQLKGRELTLAMGAGLVLDALESMRLIGPRVVTLRFR